MASSSGEPVADHFEHCSRRQEEQRHTARSTIAILWRQVAEDTKFVRDLEINQRRIEDAYRVQQGPRLFADIDPLPARPQTSASTGNVLLRGKGPLHRRQSSSRSHSPSRSRTPSGRRAGSLQLHHFPCAHFNYIPPGGLDSGQSYEASSRHFTTWAEARLTDHGPFPISLTIRHLVSAGFVNPCILAQSSLQAALNFFDDYLSTDKPDAAFKKVSLPVLKHLHFLASEYLSTYWTASDLPASQSNPYVSDRGPAWVVLALNPAQASSLLTRSRPHNEKPQDPHSSYLALASRFSPPVYRGDRHREYVR